MSTRANPVTDPYAAYGGSVAAPAAQKGNPYASYGGTVAEPSPAGAAPGGAFERAVQERMSKYGEPQAVAERHVRGEIPQNVAHPPKPATFTDELIQGADKAASLVTGASPAVTMQAYRRMKQPGLENKLQGGAEYLVSGIPFGGAPLARAMEESGAGKYGKAALHTAEAIPQLAALPFAEERVVPELVGEGADEYLPEAQRALLKTGQATLKRAPETAATAIAEPVEHAAEADPYKEFGGSVAEPHTAEPRTSGAFAPDEEVAAQRLARRASEGDQWAAEELQRRAAAGDPYAAKLVPTSTAPAAPTEVTGPAASAEAAPAPIEAEQTIPAETGQRILNNTETLRQLADPERIQSEADVQRMLDEAGSRLEKNPELRAGKVVPFDEQRELAHNLGMTPQELLNMKGSQALNAEQLLAARALTAASRDETMNLARLAATGDKDYQQRFLEALARHQEIADSLRARLSEAGRALGSLRNQPEQRTVGDALAALSKLDDNARLAAARDLSKIDPSDTPAIEKFIRRITPKSTWDKINEYWLNAILSGGTSVKKAAADTAMRVLGVAERPTAAAIDAMRSLVTGTPRTRYFGETAADLYGTFKAMPQALSQFWSTFAHNQGFDQVLDPLSGGRAYVPAIKGTLGEIVRTPTRLLESITDAAQMVNYNADLYARAYRQAAREGLSGSELLSRTEEIAGKAFADPDNEMSQAAYDYARRRTFTQNLGKTGRAISSLTHQPGIRYVVPFARIPLNIVKAGVEYSPAGLLRSQTPETAARAVLGTALAAAFLKHALNGEITGSGTGLSTSDRLRLESKGWQPDSIRVGNRFYSYRYLEPIAPVLGMAADLAKAMKDKNKGEIQTVSKQMSKAVAAQLENLPFLSGLLFLNHALEDPEKYAGNFGASFIPTALADVAHMRDRTIRAPKTIRQQFENRIPGMGKNVPALRAPALPPGVRNIYHLEGTPLLRPLSAVGGFNPFAVTTAQPGLGSTKRQIGGERRRLEQRRKRRAYQ